MLPVSDPENFQNLIKKSNLSSKHVRELIIVILNGTSAFKKVLPVRKWYFRFQNFVLNCNTFSKMSLNAQNREFQGHCRSEGVTSGFKILFSIFKKYSMAREREF